MSDVRKGFIEKGKWRKKIIDRLNKASRTFSKLSRTYIAVPPPEGWPGGHPRENGWRPGSK